MKRKLKKYNVGGNIGFKPPKFTDEERYLLERESRNARINPSEATQVKAYSGDTSVNTNFDVDFKKQQYKVDPLGLASGVLKGTNMTVGAIADFVNNSRNRTAENKQYYASLRDTEESDFVQNDIPMYTKYGGGIPREKALKILRDGKANGQPLSKKQKRFFAAMAFKKAMEGLDVSEAPMDMWGIMQEGGDVPEVMGLPDGMEDQAWIEAEAGEVYKQPDGQVLKISDDGDRHEDGGEYINNVEKVLEDTSTSRRDKRSRSLAITPDKMMAMFGIEVDKNLSHSEALETVSADIENKTKGIKSKLAKVLKSLDNNPNNKYAKNSLEFNVKELSKYPSKEEVFDALFNHQESLKEEMNMKQAKYGIALPKAQDGLEVLYKKANSSSATKADIEAFQKAFNSDERTKDYAKQLVSTRGSITKYGQAKGYKQDDVRQNEDGLLGETTSKYFDYFNQINKAEPVITGRNVNINMPTALTKGATNITPAAQVTEDESVDNVQQGPTPTQYSEFNEPLRWTDIMAPAAAYLSADRIPAKYNPAQFKKVDARLENVLPYLQQGQRDFNAITSMVDNSGSGQANLANVFAQKYTVDNQTRATVNDRNIQRQSAADMYNAQVADKQSVADQQARASFEQQQLLGTEAQRQQKLRSLDEMLQRVNLNRKQNREGNLLMKLFPNFDSYGNYNGNKRYFSTAGNTSTGVKGTGTNAAAQEERMRQLGIIFSQMKPAERQRLLQEYGRNDRADNRPTK